MRKTKPSVVVLGGGYAGLMALARIRQSGLADITLVDAKAHFEQRVRHHQHLTGQHTAGIGYAGISGIRFVQGQVERIDPHYRLVYLSQRAEPLPYDYLVLALGSQPDRGQLAGAGRHGVQLHGEAALAGLPERLGKLARRRAPVSVIGGGLSGIETAAELAERYPGLRVSLLSARPLGEDLSDAGTACLTNSLRRLGVEVVEGVRVREVGADSLLLGDGSERPSALSVCLTGMRASPLAAASGLTTQADGRVPVATDLSLPSDPRIVVPGDTGVLQQADGRALRMSCAVGMPLGAHAGDNVVASLRGQATRPFAFGYIFRCISLGRQDGLIQFVDACDRPRDRIWSGRLAARTKEWVCRYTLTLPWLELRGLRLLHWPQSAATEASLLPETSAP